MLKKLKTPTEKIGSESVMLQNTKLAHKKIASSHEREQESTSM
jgi:hypothetical protein